MRTPNTRRYYLGSLNNFLQFRDLKNPDKLLELTDQQLVDEILEYSLHKDKEGRRKLAQDVKGVIKSFLASNDRQINAKRLRMHKVPETAKNYQRSIPSKEQVYAIADGAGKLRDKAIILFLWQSGLRNGTLRNLKIHHVKAGLIRGDIPLKINIDPNIDKQSLREPYYTYISHSAIDSLVAYLTTRSRNLAALPDNQPLFISYPEIVGRIKPLCAVSLLRVVKQAAKHAGFDPRLIWTHLLRKSFYNSLLGTVDDTIREFLMEHELLGSRDAYFAPEWEHKIREAYCKVQWNRERIVEVRDSKTEEEVERLRNENDMFRVRLGRLERSLQKIASDEIEIIKQ